MQTANRQQNWGRQVKRNGLNQIFQQHLKLASIVAVSVLVGPNNGESRMPGY